MRQTGPIAHCVRGAGLAALALLALVTSPARADTLIDNVRGITLNGRGEVVRFSGLVIGKDGKVTRLIGPKDAPPANRPEKPKRSAKVPAEVFDQRLDGQGRVLLPGLIDAHGHVMGLGLQQLTLDLSDTKSLAEAQAKIAAYARANPQRRWIIGRGWNQEIWQLGRFPTAAELDAVVADRPVWLERVDGHAGWANSAAMAAAGITAATKSPAGGQIISVGGKPSGVFVDAASDLVTAHMPQPLAKERDLALAKAQTALLSLGITGIADMGTTLDDWLSFRRAGDEGWLRMRIFSYAAGIDPMQALTAGAPTPWLYDDKLRMIGVKLYADGALGSRGAWLKGPYADSPAAHGSQFLSDAQIRNLMSRAAMDGFQVAVHAIGDAANAQALDAIADVAQSFGGDRRWRIEHAQIVDPSDIARFASLHVIASMQPVHQTSDRLMAEARLTPAQLRGAYAWHAMQLAGVRLAFGSDTPVESPDPFAGLAAAITRTDAQGQPLGGWHPNERVSPADALAGFTTGAAYASFAEARVGRLAPGFWADFILVDTDPLTASAAALRATKVDESWVGGQRVWQRSAAH